MWLQGSPVAVQSKLQSHTASESALRGEVVQLIWRAGEPRDQVARMPQECDHKMEDVPFERDSLQVCPDSTASYLSSVRNFLAVVHELHEHHRRRSAASH